MLSVFLLFLLWALVAPLDKVDWRNMRHAGLNSNDPDYLSAVVRESERYLRQHADTSSDVLQSVVSMRAAAEKRLEVR